MDFQKIIYWPWLKALVFNYTIIALAIFVAIYSGNLFIMWLATLFIGNRQHALAILGHEGTHFFVSKIRWLNELLTIMFCYGPLFINHFSLREFHWEHHKHVNTDNDPEVPSRAKVGLVNASKFKILTGFITDLIGMGAIRGFILMSHIKTNKEDYLPRILFVIFYALLCYIYWPIVALWFFSMATSYVAFFRFRVFHEHVDVKVDHTHRIKDSILNEVFFPHNGQYHWEHHEKPGVPFDKLPEIADKDRKHFCDIHH